MDEERNSKILLLWQLLISLIIKMRTVLLFCLNLVYSFHFPQNYSPNLYVFSKFRRSATQDTIEHTISSENGDRTVQSSSNDYDWEKQWYPLILSDVTDKSKPHQMQLLGKNLVLWHDGSNWQAFSDSCPHRGARLSEGRIEPNGRLLCGNNNFFSATLFKFRYTFINQ